MNDRDGVSVRVCTDCQQSVGIAGCFQDGGAKFRPLMAAEYVAVGSLEKRWGQVVHDAASAGADDERAVCPHL